MRKVVDRLDLILPSFVGKTNELWVAVGLLMESGLNKLMDHVSIGAHVQFLVGVDMPTPPTVLKRLLRLQARGHVTCRIYDGSGYFHPKVYLARKGNRWTAYVGSANVTEAAFSRNVEMTLATTDNVSCAQLRAWFEGAFAKSLPLSQSLVDEYANAFDPAELNRLASGRVRLATRRAMRSTHEEVLADRSRLVSEIKRLKTEFPVSRIVKQRGQAVRQIRLTLDYPNFKRIDLDRFFQETALGHLIAVSKPQLKRNVKALRRTLLTLCDEGVPVEERYQRAVCGDLKVPSAGPNLLSKVLTVHRPGLYGVLNGPALKALAAFGIEFPRGLNPGERYVYAVRNLREVSKEANIPNLAVLDYYLWLISSEGA